MCGIAGIVRLGVSGRPEDRARVASMVAALRHRGPDESNVDVVGGATLGHTRLSILDLTAAARQPMRGSEVALTYNGELFEYRELRGLLASRGVQVASTGDTEVLLRLLELEWEGCLARLHGMFAFAAVHEKRGELLLVRDTLGKKPLFFVREPRGVVFASELSALAAAGIPLVPDPSRFAEFLVRGYVPSPHTLCRNVEQVSPGEAIVFRADGTERRWRYARLPWLDDTTPRRISTVADAEHGVRERFVAAVQKRMIADVPVGAFLSGGFDSAAVVAAARSASDTNLQTFTIGFSGASDFDETENAARSAQIIGTAHRARVLDIDALQTVAELTMRSGEAQGDSSAVPTYAVSSFAAEHVKVVLTGDGGDELFAGYDRFLLAFLSAVAPQRAGSWLASQLHDVSEGPATLRWLRRVRRLARAVKLGPAATLMEWAGGVQIMQVEALVRCPLDVEDLARPESRVFGEARSRGAPLLHAILTANLATYLPGDILVKLDRATMAVGLEARSPFLDEELLAYAARLAPLLIARGTSLKWIAKRALAPLVPKEIAQRRKRGFGAPVGHWFRGKSLELRESLLSPNAKIAGYVDVNAVRELIDAHAAGQEEAGILLWRLLALEEWLRWCAGATPHLADYHTALDYTAR